MNLIVESIHEIDNWLMNRRIDHFFVGGLAVQHWGIPDMQAQIEVCVAIDRDGWPLLVQDLLKDFSERTGCAEDHAAKWYLLPLYSGNAFPLDVSLALPLYQNEVIQDIKHIEIAPETMIPVCSAEDLIVYEMVVGVSPQRDRVEGIIARQGKNLRTDVVRERLQVLGDRLEEPGLLKEFERLLDIFAADAEEDK